MPYRRPKQPPWSPVQRQALSSLSPIQEEILRNLVEGGEDDLRMVVNLLTRAFHAVPHEALIADIEEAVADMQSSGLITLCRYQGGPRGGCTEISPEEVEQVLALRDVLEWDAVHGSWHWRGAELGLDEVVVAMPWRVLDAFRITIAREHP